MSKYELIQFTCLYKKIIQIVQIIVINSKKFFSSNLRKKLEVYLSMKLNQSYSERSHFSFVMGSKRIAHPRAVHDTANRWTSCK